MNEHRNCTCPASKSGSFQIATDHYSRNFIPTGWKLEYTSLEQHEPQRFLYMTGWCLRCGGQDLQSGISIPDELSGDALLERIYREMEHYRPFEHRRSDGTYNRSLLGRAAWYMEQDDLTLGEKNAQFLKLFHEEDQRAVEDWICRNRAEEPYTVPRRDRKSTLLYAVLDRARANGDLREIEPIWDYYLPNKNEPLSPDILNALLTALNERRYTNEGKTIHIPTISFFSASNEIPNFANPEEKILKPLYDRFELKVVTEYVEDRDARLTILKQKQAAQGTAQNPSAVISLAELQAMQDEVLQVRVPDQVNELMDDVLCELRGKGIHISDRKYFNYAPIAQAKAWLSGRDTVEPSDLTTLCAYLWTAPEERTIIQSTLERMCNDPLKDRLDTILAEAVEGYQEFTDTADAPAARRIGKLRDEFMSLYITLSQMLSNAQSDAEREKINACLEELERYSKEAHASVQYSYVPLRELYDLKAS